MEATKVCSKCGDEKAVGEFHLNQYQCKHCCSTYYQENKKRCLLKSEIYRKKHKEKTLEYQIEYRKNNVKKISICQEKNYKKRKSIKLVYQKQRVSALVDSYICKLLKSSCVPNPTPEIIELKRQEIILHRALKEVNKALKGSV